MSRLEEKIDKLERRLSRVGDLNGTTFGLEIDVLRLSVRMGGGLRFAIRATEQADGHVILEGLSNDNGGTLEQAVDDALEEFDEAMEGFDYKLPDWGDD